MDQIHSSADNPALQKDYSPNIPLNPKGLKYLFLHLQDECAELYYFNSIELVHLHSCEIDISAIDDYPPAAPETSQTGQDLKDAFLHIFCHKVDKELVQILKEHPLPVFILGDPPVLRRFKKITRNAEFIVAYIPFIQPQKKPPEGGFYKTA